MKVVPFAETTELAWEQPRGGEIRTRPLLRGEDGSADNFVFHIHHSVKDFVSPRHRHNFEQVRYHFEGETTFAEGKLTAGMIGYFPAGTSYGPHSSTDGARFTVLQYGGDPGYVSHAAITKAIQALKQKGGTFEGGVFTWHDEQRKKHNRDAYEAAWEEFQGRKLVYPKPAYQGPIFIDPGHYDWLPVAGSPAVHEKALGQFNQRRTSISFFRVDAGGELELSGNTVGFVIQGNGLLADAAYGEQTSIHLDRGETRKLRATKATELLLVGMRP